MHDQSNTTTETAAPAGADRELQRASLRDLVALLTECAKSETEIDQGRASAVAEEDKRFAAEAADVTRRHAARHGEVGQKVDTRRGEILQKHATEQGAVDKAHQSAKVRIEYDKETVDHDARKQLEHATWVAGSIFDGTSAKLNKDFQTIKEQADADEQWIADTETRLAELLLKLGFTPPQTEAAEADDAETEDAAGEADTGTFDDHRGAVERQVRRIASLTLPRLFVGITPWLVMILLAAAAGIAAAFIFDNPLRWDIIVGAVVGTIVVVGALGFLFRSVGQKQIAREHVPLRRAIGDATRAIRQTLARAARERDTRIARAAEVRAAEVKAAKEKLSPVIAKGAEKHKAAMATTTGDYAKKRAQLDAGRDKLLKQLDEWREKHLAELGDREAKDAKATRDAHEARAAEIEGRYKEQRAALEARWAEGLARLHAPIDKSAQSNGRSADDWSNWKPPTDFPAAIPFGQLTVNPRAIAKGVLPPDATLRLPLPETFTMPALLAFPRQSSLLIQHDHSGRGRAIETLRTMMSRLLTSFPPGRVRFTIFDPQGLGQNFAGFMHLADYDENLVGKRIWTNAEHIEQRLNDLTEHMETVIQKYLRNEFETIDQYNMQAGELAEPYRFLVVADFPVGFQGDSLRRLASIASTGARCGVYTLIARDLRQPLPAGGHMDELEAHGVNLVQQGDRFVWKDEIFKQFSLALDSPPADEQLTEILHVVGKGAKEASRVEVPFDQIAPHDGEYWSGSSTNELGVAIGRLGATRNQMLKLGRGVAQHALIAGKTGSGKSTLLHAIITNLAMWYSPDEVEFYLIDFKKGVEFKTYATNLLPHARAIAVESDREFGLSVLQRIDAELARRGELFRKAGVQDLAGYRASSGAKVMPRVLLISDEFQEFFSEDDRVSQEAGVLLDRLVRQGRAFGIHVILGSQTIGGTSGLARSTLGQMAVRIALQCSEADSQLILGDNNSAARLLSRPGEAVYNDAGGLVEGNSPFQVAWLSDDLRDEYLQRVCERGKADAARREPAIVFEGNAPADLRKNGRLTAALAGEAWPTDSGAPRAWLGEPVAIKDPTAVTFRRQSGSNLLVVGQSEEQAMAVMATSLVSLAAQRSPAAARFVVFDGSAADSPVAGVFKRVAESLPHDVRLVEYRDVERGMAELAEELERRQSSEANAAQDVYVVIHGMQRYRALRKQEQDFSFSTGGEDEKKAPNPDKVFADLLREGSSLGMHVLAWADTSVAVDRSLDRGAMREFDNRVLFQMSAADSSNLIDSPMANKLGPYRAISYSEEQGVMEKFRPYAIPAKAWLDGVKQSLASRTPVPSPGTPGEAG